jgi:ribosomal protein S27AE
MFQDRKIIIATKHQKEKAIAPILKQELGVICFVDESFDSDLFGTFSGEVKRELKPIATAREKCLTAMKKNNCDLGIASEGSFGPHPYLHFIEADDELLIFIDIRNKIEIIVNELSTSTNFHGKKIQNTLELLDFANQVKFPEHGIILKNSKDNFKEIFKGIVDFESLEKTYEYLYTKYQSVFAESDMRALYNPTRMRVIEIATHKLIQKIKSVCPKCKFPGFGITDANQGLLCGLCGLPTNSILSYIYKCQNCHYTKEELYPNSKKLEDPMYCNYCNP